MIALLFPIGAVAQSLCEGPFTWGYCPPETQRVKPNQQTQSAGSGQSQRAQSIQASPDVAPGGQPVERSDTKAERERDAEKAAQEASEYWTFLWHRLKITDSLLAVFTFFLVVVGVVQGWALIRSVNLARDEFNATHRPEIIVHSFETTRDFDEKGTAATVGAHLSVVNKGTTEARITKIEGVTMLADYLRAGISISDLGIKPFTLEGGRDRENVAIFGSVNDKLAAQLLSGFKDNETKLWCIGRITYEDTDGRRRQMGFCRSYNFKTETWAREPNSDYEYSY